MRLYLLRHGSRNHGLGDGPLNSQGLLEAQNLTTDPRLASVRSILTSPKKRAQMTVAPLADHLHLTLQTVSDLDQQGSSESHQQFRQRVLRQIQQWEHQSNQIDFLVCSHSDWLALAVEILDTGSAYGGHFFQCAEFIAYDWADGVWHPVQFKKKEIT